VGAAGTGGAAGGGGAAAGGGGAAVALTGGAEEGTRSPELPAAEKPPTVPWATRELLT